MDVSPMILVSLPVAVLVAAWLLGFLVGWAARWVERRLDDRSAERAAAGAFPVIAGPWVPAAADANAVPAVEPRQGRRTVAHGVSRG